MATKAPIAPATGAKPARAKKSPAAQKATFKDEVSSRIESSHEAVMYQRAISREDLEMSFGVGDYDLFFKEFVSYFKQTRTDKLTKEEAAQPNLRIKELSKLRWRKSRRRRRGKLKKNTDNSGKK
ncbi:hypothetical protein [Microcoleus sp. bin38.metabat.b11b12b14.051]|uniref:hypothetical protein n=1 Tax=Microcoleus sp. bin38.metabat.b11b12b14.051 TaxID=2742709 RepID=UPI0025D89480|nr:hypothetical protein [Microcoleus sp. bin38.metabat.b11b12b14.051]